MPVCGICKEVSINFLVKLNILYSKQVVNIWQWLSSSTSIYYTHFIC